jgi:hypothetical protein
VNSAVRRALLLLARALLFFVLYWGLAPAALYGHETKWQFIESCVFGVVAAFVPWRRGWKALQARSGSATAEPLVVGEASTEPDAGDGAGHTEEK